MTMPPTASLRPSFRARPWRVATPVRISATSRRKTGTPWCVLMTIRPMSASDRIRPIPADDELLGGPVDDVRRPRSGCCSGWPRDTSARARPYFSRLVRVHHHLVLLDVAAERVHLVDARHALEQRRHHPVLQRAQLGQAPDPFRLAGRNRPLEGVLVDLAHGGGHGPHLRLDPLGQLSRHAGQPLEHQLPGEVDVHVVAEDEGQHRQAVLGDGAHGVQPGQAPHGRFRSG